MALRASPSVLVALGALLLLLFAVHEFQWQDGGVHRALPTALSGDEPHYLLMTSSLVFDGDLEVGTDYERVAAGGAQAGQAFRGVSLDHHTLLVGQGLHDSVLWHALCLGNQHAPSERACRGFQPTGAAFPSWPYREVMAHPAGLALLVSAILAPFHPPSPQALEHGFSGVMLALAALAVLAVHGAARGMGISGRSALLGALLLAVASPWLPYERAYFAELPAGALIALGFWMFVADQPQLAGAALGSAVWLKPPFLLLGGGLLLALALRRSWRTAIKVAWPFGGVTAALLVFNEWSGRRALISGTSGWTWASGLKTASMVLVEEWHGLLVFVPWVVIPFAVLVLAVVHVRRSAVTGPPVILGIALGVLPYTLLLLAFGTGPGICYGPRYFVPVLPLLALVAAWRFETAGPRLRAALVVLGVLGALVAVPAAFRYRAAFDKPFYAALRMEKA